MNMLNKEQHSLYLRTHTITVQSPIYINTAIRNTSRFDKKKKRGRTRTHVR